MSGNEAKFRRVEDENRKLKSEMKQLKEEVDKMKRHQAGFLQNFFGQNWTAAQIKATLFDTKLICTGAYLSKSLYCQLVMAKKF